MKDRILEVDWRGLEGKKIRSQKKSESEKMNGLENECEEK
jgi:hypothetical protein